MTLDQELSPGGTWELWGRDPFSVGLSDTTGTQRGHRNGHKKGTWGWVPSQAQGWAVPLSPQGADSHTSITAAMGRMSSWSPRKSVLLGTSTHPEGVSSSVGSKAACQGARTAHAH